MSAFPRITTAKADISNWSCPLYPRKRTCAVQSEMSAKGQTRTSGLFDQLVSTPEHLTGNLEAKCFRGREIDEELKVGRLYYRQVSRFLAF